MKQGFSEYPVALSIKAATNGNVVSIAQKSFPSDILFGPCEVKNPLRSDEVCVEEKLI